MSTKVTKASHGDAVRLMMLAFPSYRGRKFYIDVSESVYIRDFWDGGSRDYARFLHIPSGQIVGSDAIPMSMRQKAGNWFGLPIAEGTLRPDVALVEHSISCGKDCGLTLTLHPGDAATMLPTPRLALAQGETR